MQLRGHPSHSGFHSKITRLFYVTGSLGLLSAASTVSFVSLLSLLSIAWADRGFFSSGHGPLASSRGKQ